MIKIIAELAQGYEGNVEIAKLLVKAASKTAADAIKIQCIYADELATKKYKHYNLFKQLEMPQQTWYDLAQMTKKSGKEFYLDVFGDGGLEIAKYVEADAIKIHTTDFFNEDLISDAFKYFNKIFLAIGGIYMDEIKSLVEKYGKLNKDLCLMFGHQTEPTPLNENNLNKIKILKSEFPNIKVGFMDHSEYCSPEAHTLSILPVAMDVSYIEKHMTLDHKLALEDYISAITPKEFDAFIETIRRHEIAMGGNDFLLGADDLKYRNNVVKVAVAVKPIKAGDVITKDCIGLKRIKYQPYVSYIKLKSVIENHVAKRDINTDEAILTEDFE